MAAAFTIVYTPAGGDAVTLADVAARHTAEVAGPFGGAAVEDVVHMFQAANPLRLLLGNVSGQLVFTSELAQTTRALMAAYFVTQFALINTVGTVVITIDATTMTMANATLKGVEAMKFEGVRWPIRYTFGITTIV